MPDEEVIELYGGTQHIPLYQMSDFYGKVLYPLAAGMQQQLFEQPGKQRELSSNVNDCSLPWKGSVPSELQCVFLF